jgi:hypothetical protein
LPLFLMGLSSWTAGFWKACWDKTEDAVKA